jgi:hypothetical protein
MFRAFSCPSSGATNAVAASGLPSELGDSSAAAYQTQEQQQNSGLEPKRNLHTHVQNMQILYRTNRPKCEATLPGAYTIH